MRTMSAFSLCWFSATAAVVSHARPAAADGLEAGVTFGGHVFSSDSELGVSDRMDGASPQTSVVIGGQLGYAFLPNFAAELVLALIPTVDDAAERGAVVFGSRAQLRYQPFGDTLMNGKLRPFVLAGYGVLAVRTDSDQLRNDIDQAIHWGVGTTYALTRSMDLRLDATHLLVPDRSKNGATSNFELTAGVIWRFGAAPRGVSGSTAVAAAATPSAPSAPPAPTAAPAAAAPAATPAIVSSAGTASPPRTAPSPSRELDTDNDGVVDAQDACSDRPEDRDGFEDEDGCAEPDNDRDSIADGADRCPLDPEAPNGYADQDGCPEVTHPDMSDLLFARNAEGFSGEAAVQLDLAFRTLQANGSLRVELSGHTSSDESSRTLSLRRAQAVKDYLVRRGISADRLRVVGYRAERPATSDKSSPGRARNRRVMLRLLPLDEVIR
jgi:OmpA-OmpF porin, OOP family